MKLNSLHLAVALAATTAISWIICSLLVWLFPRSMMSLTGQMLHLDISGLGWVLTLSGVIWGLILWSVTAGVFAWLAANIYNLLAGK